MLRKAATVILAAGLWICMCPSSLRAQGASDEELRQDVRALRQAELPLACYAEGERKNTPVGQALQHLRDNLRGFVALVDEDMVFPDQLTAYSNSVDVNYYQRLIAVLDEFDQPAVRELLRRVYFDTAAGADTLYARFTREMSQLGGAWTDHEVTRELISALSAASAINVSTLKGLTHLNDSSVVDQAMRRYELTSPSGRVAIEKYVSRMTGSFPRPASTCEMAPPSGP